MWKRLGRDPTLARVRELARAYPISRLCVIVAA